MNRFFYILLVLWSILSFYYSKADTIDVWTVKLNDKIILRSNEYLIVDQNEPMKINIVAFLDSDTLKIFYATDVGIEKNKWYFTFKDSNDLLIDIFSNPTDSTIRCFPTPCKIFPIRKNYIAFKINDLKLMMKGRNIDVIYVEFNHDNPERGQQYRNKRVAVIINKVNADNKN